MDMRAQETIDECKRQEESCLYTSASLFEWLKALRFWRVVFIVAPICLGALATAPILAKQADLEWFTAVCALLAGIFPAIYKALDLDISLKTIAVNAYQFKMLQDRFRQAWRVSSHGPIDDFTVEFKHLMDCLDNARIASMTAPERFFEKARKKIKMGHYNFEVDPR